MSLSKSLANSKMEVDVELSYEDEECALTEGCRLSYAAYGSIQHVKKQIVKKAFNTEES